MQTLIQKTDEVLVRLYEEGNDAAFDTLLDRYQKTLYGYILTLVCDTDKADDIFQDTFFKAIHYIRSHRYVDSGKFQAWLMRIAHNLIADTHRRQAPIVEVKDDKERQRILEGNNTMAVGSVEDEFHNTQTYSDLTQMIARLPEPQQEVVRMRIYENRSFKEIADLTRCSINTALGRMRYALINLRKIMTKHHVVLE